MILAEFTTFSGAGSQREARGGRVLRSKEAAPGGIRPDEGEFPESTGVNLNYLYFI